MIFLAAIIGYSIGGYSGAFTGILAGWMLKSAMNSFLVNKHQGLFLNSLFAMLAKMAKADGVISKEEIDAVTRFISTIRLNSKDKKTAINAFRNASSDERSIYQYASQYRKIASVEMRSVVYAVLWDVAHSDGVLHEKEEEILRKIPEYLGLNDSVYYQYKDRVHHQNDGNRGDINKSYKVLGCNKDSSDKEIKRAYRRAIAKHHPDKIQSQGLPKEFMDFANEQSKKINKAYEVIKKSRQI